MKIYYLPLFCVSTVFAQIGDKQDIKCHVNLTSGKQRILFFDRVASTPGAMKQNQVGQKVFNSDGKTYSIVSTVFECVADKDKFSSSYARKLEQVTPR